MQVMDMHLEMKFYCTGSGFEPPASLPVDLAQLCKSVYGGLPWYERGVTPPLLNLAAGSEPGGLLLAYKGPDLVAAHGYREMETKIRLTSWGPAVLPGHEPLSQDLISYLMERGRALGKERVVYVLVGEPGGKDAEPYLQVHEKAGLRPVMRRLDMEAPLAGITVHAFYEPPAVRWEPVDADGMDAFLPLYGEVFTTSDSPLAASWARDLEDRRWWFEQLMRGEDDKPVPGGWLTLKINEEPVGLLIMTEKSRSVVQISDLGILERQRGRRLGWLIMSKAVEIAREASYRTVSLGVEIENRVAIGLYEASGFHAVSRTSVFLHYFNEAK